MDIAHGIGTTEVEQIVVAAHLAIPGVETRAAIAFLVQLQRLDHGAHGTIEHQDALLEQTEKLGPYACVGHYCATCSRCVLARIHRPQAQQVTDREDEVGAIHCVEVEGRDPAIDKIEHLLGGNSRGNQLACRRIVIEALKPLCDPARHRRAAALRQSWWPP